MHKLLIVIASCGFAGAAHAGASDAYNRNEQQLSDVAATQAQTRAMQAYTEAIRARTECLKAGGGAMCGELPGAAPERRAPQTDYACVQRNVGNYRYTGVTPAQEWAAAMQKCTR